MGWQVCTRKQIATPPSIAMHRLAQRLQRSRATVELVLVTGSTCHDGYRISELRLPLYLRTIHPVTLVTLLGDPQIWKQSWHDPPRRSSRNTRILFKVMDLLVIAQKVFVEETLSTHILGRRVQNRKNSVREYRWFPQIASVSLMRLRSSGLNSLTNIKSATSPC